MSEWWIECGDGDPIRQGDVVRRTTAEGQAAWGMIVTADCDIAQGKAGDRFTWLRIVPSHEYRRDRWAPEQLRRLVTKQGRISAEAITGAVRRQHADVGTIDEDSLLRWLKTHSPDELWRSAAPDRKPEPQVLGGLAALRVAAGIDPADDPLDRLRRAWTALGRKAPVQLAALREALDGNRGFADFFLLPDVPGGDGIGHVVLLREIAALEAAEVFASERGARLADRPTCFHRTARLHDGVRFAITQKLAFLFSRIGLTTSFEAACASATDLTVDALGFGDRP